MIGQYLSRLTKDSLIYGVGSALTSVVGIVLVPVLTRIFTPAEYGLLDLFVTIVFLTNVLLSFGFDSAMAILFFDTTDEEKRKKILSTGLLFVVIASFGLAAILYPLTGMIAAAVFPHQEATTILRFSIGLVPFNLVLGLCLGILRFRFSRGRYILTVLANVIFTIVLSLIFLIPLRMGVQGYFIAWFVSVVISAALALMSTKKNLRFIIDRTVLRQLFRLGLPLVPAGLAGWSLSLIDRFFLQGYSLDELGWYSLGVKISSILGLLISAIQLAWGPFALSIAKEPHARTTYAKVLTLFTVGSGLAAVLLTVLAPELLSLTSHTSYAQSARVVGILSLGLIAYGSYYIVAIGLSLSKRTGVISWTTMFAAALNIGLNFLLIPRAGMIGAAIATLLSYAVSSILLYLKAQHYYRVPYEVRKVVLAWFILATVVICSTLFPTTVAASLLLPKMLLVAATGFAFILLGVVERNELRAFWKSVKRVGVQVTGR